MSCLEDISRGAQSTQTEELAQTSKIPDRVKAPLASRCRFSRIHFALQVMAGVQLDSFSHYLVFIFKLPCFFITLAAI